MSLSNSHLVEVFLFKLIFNLRSEARKTYLNYLWWVIEPALYTVIFYFVFEVFLNRGLPQFVAFLLCGKIPFLWFSKSVMNSAGSIVQARGLINQIAIPKWIFPLLIVGQDFIKQLVVFTFLLVFLKFYGIEFSMSWLWIIPVLLVQLLFVASVSLVVAAVVPFIPDFKNLLSAFMMMLMFVSGIFYSYKQVILEEHQQLFLLNPLASLIVAYRDVLLYQTPPNLISLTQIAAGSILTILMMLFVYKVNNTKFTRAVMQ